MDNPTLAFCILIKLRERNQAIGIKQDTQFLRGLGDFIHHVSGDAIQTDTLKVAETSYLKGLIEEYQTLAQRVTDHTMANLDNDDTRNQGVHIVKAIDAYLTHLNEKLEALWQPSS